MSLGMQRCFGKGEGPWPALFQLYPEEEPGSLMERSLGCRRRQLSHPGSVFGTVKTCCVFCLKMNSYEEYHGSISQCCPRRIFPEQGACSWPCGWKWVFLGITGPLEYHTALWPLTPPLCGCYFPPQNRNYSIFSNKVFLLLSEISPCCPGSCLTLK